MGSPDSKQPQQIKFLRDPKDGVVYIARGVERDNLGEEPISSSVNHTYFYDSKGRYLPCTAEHYHVHRGDLAEIEWWQCNCPHETLVWMVKEHGALLCKDCDRTFVVEEDEPKAELED